MADPFQTARNADWRDLVHERWDAFEEELFVTFHMEITDKNFDDIAHDFDIGAEHKYSNLRTTCMFFWLRGAAEAHSVTIRELLEREGVLLKEEDLAMEGAP